MFPTFREAAENLGLIEEDGVWDDVLTEATEFAMPHFLCRLFATSLVFGEPSNVRRIWEKHLDAMSEDFQRDNPSKSVVEQLTLCSIRDLLQSMGKDIRLFPLPKIDETVDAANGIPREIYEELTVETNDIDKTLVKSLNEEQRFAYDEIMKAVDSGDGGLFFVDGPGRIGKHTCTRLFSLM